MSDDDPKDKPTDDSEQKSDDQPADDGDQPSEESDAKPADDGDKPADEGDQPSEESDAKPADDGDKPADEGDQPAEKSDDQPADDTEKPSDESEQQTAEQSKDESKQTDEQADQGDAGSAAPAKTSQPASEFRKRCAELLAKHEGRMKHVYLDTLQIPSIGIGFNLKRGGAREALAKVGADYDKVLAGTQDLTDAQIDGLFNRDLDTALAAAQRQVPNFSDLAFNARLVVVDMMFMGEAAFAGFKKLIAALKKLDYQTAANEMVNSQWYGQVKNRGIEDVALMRAAGK